MQWSEYTTAERLKALRSGMTQEGLAEAAAVSVGVIRKLERGGTASLPSLLSIASALGTDIAVLLGQQAPRRSMDRDERAALRALSGATHDAAIGIPADTEPGTVEELRSVVQHADAAYWAGRYTELGALLGALLPEARARYDTSSTNERETAAGVLADAFQTSGMAANVWGSRDLAYAALTYGRQIAVQAGDDLRDAHLAATTAWVNLRDGRTAQGFALAAAQTASSPRCQNTIPTGCRCTGSSSPTRRWLPHVAAPRPTLPASTFPRPTQSVPASEPSTRVAGTRSPTARCTPERRP
jgi:transcriptional regulator with XRE-family HTH domain